MARARNIKPGFFKNEQLVELPYDRRLLFIGLWMLADREGRLEDRPKRIKMEVFPADDVPINQALDDLHKSGFIVRYTVGETRFIQVCEFTKHQNPHHREPPSTIPKPQALPPLQPPTSPRLDTDATPPKPEASPRPAPEEPRQAPEIPGLAVLNPDSLIPESREKHAPEALPLPAEVKPEKRKRKPKAPEITFAEFATACRAAGEPAVPEDDPIHAWAESAGVTTEMITLCWAKFRGKYTDSDKLYADWRATFRNAVRDNWFRLWYVADDGQIRLTTNGRIIEKVAA